MTPGAPSSEVAGPFAAPRDDHGRADLTWFAVLVSWASGGALTVVAGAAVALGDPPRVWVGAALAIGAVGGAVAGLVALAVERRSAASASVVIDARGEGARPVHGGLYAGPAWAGAVSALVLAVLAVWRSEAWLAAVGCALVSAVSAWSAIRATRRHRLTRALRALDAGDLGGLSVLARLAGPWAVRDPVRATARVNLGMHALSQGRPAEALKWCAGVHGGAAAPWAAVTAALALLAEGAHPDEVEPVLRSALRAGRLVQPHADAVRVLLVWRADGPQAARALAEQVLGPRATVLHRALLEALGGRADADEPVAAFRAGPLARLFPELSR